MTHLEVLNLVFFLGMAALSWTLRLEPSRRYRVTGLGVAGIALTLASTWPSLLAVRDWLPLPMLLLAYWQSGPFFVRPNERLQQRLLQWDHLLLGQAAVPKPTEQMLELAYLFCYPFLPLGLAVLYAAGLRHLASFYWTAVLLPTYICYGLLPFLPTAPPRALEPPRPAAGVRRLNQWIARHGSIQANTFPSAHVAATMSAALVVTLASPAVGAAFLAVAVAIAAGAVLGRYHYLADAILGAALAAASVALLRAT